MIIIFDADGTLTPQRPTSTSEPMLELLPGVEEKCRELIQAGHTLAIASNQSAKRPIKDIRRQLAWTKRKIGTVTYRYATTVKRRKPAPTMLLEICRDYGVIPAEAIFIGDQETDRQASEAAGCQFAWAKDFFGVETSKDVCPYCGWPELNSVGRCKNGECVNCE